MDNDQNICQNSTDDIEVTSKVQLQFENDDFHKFWVRGDDGFDYAIAMHKSVCLLSFMKLAENTTESQISGCYIWVDADSRGRYKILDQDTAAEIKLIPAEFVRAKFTQAMYYYNIHEEVKDKLQAIKPGAEDLKLQELKSEADFHVNRLMKLLIHELENIEHIAEITENKLSLTFGKIDTINNKLIPDLIKDDKWLHLKFNDRNYYVDEIGDVQNNENDNILYYIVFHKTYKHIILVRATGQEFKIKSNVIHHLYISEDDGLGRYKVQTSEGTVSKRFFVPAGYVEGCYNIFRRLFKDFEKLQEEPDVFSRQTRWCTLQDDAIHLINQILREIKSDLKPEIEKSLEHSVMVMPFSSVIRNPRNFDEFYNRVVEAEKRMRLEWKGKTYPNSLVIFNRRHKTTFIIHINYFANDIFYLDEKVRILISKYNPDYYVMVSEAWGPKNNEIQQRVSAGYRHGDIAKLPSHEKTEGLTFIGKTKNSVNRGPDKSEIYEIIRERPNDEESRILELRKFDEGGLDFGMKYHDWV